VYHKTDSENIFQKKKNRQNYDGFLFTIFEKFQIFRYTERGFILSAAEGGETAITELDRKISTS